MAVTDKPQSLLSILSLELIAYSWHPVQVLPGQAGSFASYVTVTKAPSILRLHCLPLVSPRLHCKVISIQLEGELIIEGLTWEVSMVGVFFMCFFFIGLQVVYIISTYIPLAKIQSSDQIQLQGTLGNVFELLFQKEKHR